MREIKTFGKRTESHSKREKAKVNLGNVFGIVNNGCDSKQIETFIKRNTGIEYFKGETNGNK